MKTLTTIKDYMQFCLEQGFFCDVLFDCEDGLLGAHKIVLSMASPHLKDLINDSHQDQIIIILPEVSSKCLHLYLRILYGEMITVSQKVKSQFVGIDQLLGLNHLNWWLSGVPKKQLTIERISQNKLVVEAVTVMAGFDIIVDKASNENMEYKEKINDEDLLQSSGSNETLKVFSEDDVHELQDDSMNSLTWPYDDEQEALDKMVQDLEDSGENDSHSDDNTIQEIDDSMGELDEQEDDETLMTSSKDDSHSHTMEELTGKYKAPQTLEVGSNSLQYDDNTDDEQEVLDRMVQDLKTSGEDDSHSDDNTIEEQDEQKDDAMGEQPYDDNSIDEQKVLDRMVQDLKASGEDDSHSDDDSIEEQDEQKDDPMGELDEQDNLKTLMTSSKDDCHSLVMEKLTGKHKPPHSLAAGTNSLPYDDKTVNEQEILDKMVEDLKASGEDDSYSDDDSIEEQDEKKDDSMGELDEQENLKTLKTCSKGDFHSCSKQELTGKYKPPQTLEVGTNSLSYDDNTVDEQETLDKMVQDLKGSGEDVGISLTVDDMMETLDGKIIPRKVAEEMLKKVLKADKNMKKETHHLSHPNLIPDSPKADKITDPLSQIVSPDHSWTTMLTHTRDHVKTSTDQEYLTSSTSSEHLVLTATVKPDTEKVSEKIKENKFKYPALQRYKGFGNKLKKRKYPGFGGKIKKNKKLIPKVKGLETKKTYRISQAFSEATATKTDELNLISEDEVISEVLPRNDLISQIDGGGQELADNGSHMIDSEVQKTKEEDFISSFDMDMF